MIGFLLRTTFKLLLLSAALYVAFFVPLGKRTLAEHVRRIAGTEEAQELGDDVAGAVEEAKGALSNQLGDALAQTPASD